MSVFDSEVLQFFALCVLILAVIHPDAFFYVTNERQLHNETEVYFKDGFQFNAKETLPELPTPIPQISAARVEYQSSVFLPRNDLVLVTQRNLRTGEAHLAVVLLFGLILITTLMIYGVIKGRPLYVLPFFCFQVLDLVLACVSAIGHYTWMPSIQTIIEKNPDIPFRDQLLNVNGQWAAMGLLFFFVLMLILKV
ncbi:unnamed protein product [Soboliphyme baturini]|uniref:Amastin n=1 Tax=Soboliphyme baturini TaxID=241478 RepID=A0A183IFW8_9BILA|nr:unnamed protein product [Soboliphyme baturini]